MKVTQISIGRFHHFHLARQLEKYNLLDSIYTGYPKFKLKDEIGIGLKKIKTFPWVHAPYMKRGVIGLDKFHNLNKHLEWIDRQSLDYYVANNLKKPTILIALSGCGLISGKKVKKMGGIYVCDRGSSHIRFQNDILKEEFEQNGIRFKGIDSRVIDKEESEYENANFITVPSEFVKQSFVQMGVDENKIIKIPYGARLDRFSKISNPQNNKFKVLWVGSISLRKGFLYALEAFQNLDCEYKEFLVIGNLENDIKDILIKKDLTNVNFMGNVQNKNLPHIYSTSHVFLLSSIEEGLSMVMGEALSCGCPVIATENTGARDLFTDNIEGFVVPIRSSEVIKEKLQLFVDNPNLRIAMSNAALDKVIDIGGWDGYGEKWRNLLKKYNDY